MSKIMQIVYKDIVEFPLPFRFTFLHSIASTTILTLLTTIEIITSQFSYKVVKLIL